jgi:hypothetical protein
MGKRTGNPVWYKGMPSANAKGRPKGQTNLATYLKNPRRINPPFLRWERFCWGLLDPPYTGASAARRAGYSPKSARFIASRLRRNPIIKDMLRRIRERIKNTRKIGDGVYLIPDDEGKYHIYRNKNIAKKAREEVNAMLKKYK